MSATVRRLELKVPPLLVICIFAALMWLIARWLPGIMIEPTFRLIAILVFLIAGVIFVVTGILAFKMADTTVNPLKPGESSTLVTTGIYRVSRNPMYVGFLFLLLAWGLYLTNLYSLLSSAGFIWYLNRFQIRAEEGFLQSSFGDQYQRYQSQVRRWL